MQKETKNETKLVSNVERGKRVRAERKRLRLTQQEVADACGVHRVQWGRYERGEQGFDGEPLRKFGEMGASIGFILTGEENTSNARLVGAVAPSKKSSASDDETKMVALFRKLSKEKQAAILETARLMAEG